MIGDPQLSTINPFDSEGLPFAGLAFLHNYNPDGGIEPTSVENLWSSLGTEAFNYGPEVPFSFADGQNGEQIGL